MKRPAPVAPGALTRFLLLDPVFAIVLVAVCVIGGLIAFDGMVREELPDLEIPQAVVTVEWIGATPEQIEKEILRPLEKELRSLPRLKATASSAQHSFALVSVRFEAEADLQASLQILQARTERAAADFPKAAKRPRIEPIAVNDTPVQTYALSGSDDPGLLARAAKRLKDELESVRGVRKVTLYGHREEVLHVRLDPVALRTSGLSSLLVRERLRAADLDLAWGELEEARASTPLNFEARYRSPEEIAALPIKDLGDGRIVELGELARSFVGLQQEIGGTRIADAEGRFLPAVSIAILKRPGVDTLSVIDAVEARIAELRAAAHWSSGLRLTPTSDEREAVERGLNEVGRNLLQGTAAVFAVLLVLLSWRAAATAAIGMPITILAAVGLLYAVGYTLNTLVLIGVVIALGLLVDMFILVMEGLHERMVQRGLPFGEAVVETAQVFFLPALAGQLTTILAMVPLLTIGGIDGKFIRLIPVAAIVCLVVSFGLAFLAALPLSRLLTERAQRAPAPSAVDRLTERVASALRRLLLSGPLHSKANAAGCVLAAVLVFGLSLFAASDLDLIDYPREDGRNLGITIELQPDATLADVRRVADKAGRALTELPYLESVSTHAGEKSAYALKTVDDFLSALGGYHLVGVSARFVPKDAREALAFTYLPEIRATLETALGDEAGAVLRLRPDLGGATAEDPVQIEIIGDEIRALRRAADQVSRLLLASGQATDVRDTLGPLRGELRFQPDRDRLAFYGITEAELAGQMRIAISGEQLGKFRREGQQDDLDIELGTDWPGRAGRVGGPTDFAEIESLSIATDDGRSVPLAALVERSVAAAPIALTRKNGRRAVTVKAQLAEGATLTSLYSAIWLELESLQKGWPPGTTWRAAGAAETGAERRDAERRAFLLAVLLVFAILALLFGSFLQPFIILATLPLSLTGSFLGFAALGIPISFPAMVGMIALIGIVVNDAIVMVDTMNRHRARGLTLREAAARGAADRLRPIFTTTVTTIAGLLPLALSAPVWYPLCMAIILGEALGTVFAVFVIPALFVLLTRNRGAAASEGPDPRRTNALLAATPKRTE